MRPLMRPAAACAVLVLAIAACSPAFWRSENGQVVTTVSVSPDTALRVATTQLEHHGFRVYHLGEGELLTEPRAVPDHARLDGQGDQWMVRVRVEPLSFVRGSRLQVTAYTVPVGTMVRPTSDNQVRENAILVTTVNNPQLYREVEAIAGWINDAAGRRGQ